MTERYEQTGETKIEHSRENKIRGISTCHEIAVSQDTLESLIQFSRSRNTMSMSFNAMVDGCTEFFTLYRFTNDEKTRINMFLHTDRYGYEEIITINSFGLKDARVNTVTVDGHSFTFYKVDDLHRHEMYQLIGHIMTRLINLNNMVESEEDKEIISVMYDYGKMIMEKYK